MPSVSKAQKGLMGAAYACKKGNGPCKGGAAKVAKGMSQSQLKDFAKGPSKGLPKRKKKRGMK